MPQNLPIDEFIALQKLSVNKDLVIQRSDMGNSVARLHKDRQDYIKKMDNILSDLNKITLGNLKDDIQFYCQPRKTR